VRERRLRQSPSAWLLLNCLCENENEAGKRFASGEPIGLAAPGNFRRLLSPLAVHYSHRKSKEASATIGIELCIRATLPGYSRCCLRLGESV
jgi:hypothetical protein